MMVAEEVMNETLVSETKLEAYSVVLSVTTLLLAAIGGGTGSLTAICAILSGKSIHKLSYSMVLVLLFASLILDLFWAPQEIVHLLYFHYMYENPTEHLKIFIHGTYLFMTIIIALCIIFVSVENIVNQCTNVRKIFKKIWSISGCVSSVAVGVSLAVMYVAVSIHNEVDVLEYYVVMNDHSFKIKVIILGILAFLVLAAMMGVIITAIIKKKSNRNFNENNEHKNQIPQLLIRDPEGNVSEDESEESPSVRAASPVPMLGINAAGGLNREGPLQNSPKNKNMLGVNMAQILGRRRHTICQIGDSSNTFMDPAEKAKKYNYVRKFSVDISALQAQLENPKIFSGKSAFQSDTDLQVKPQPIPQRGRLPAKPILRLEEKEERADAEEVKCEAHPMLPVITVSDDEGPEKEEAGAKSDHEDGDDVSEKQKTTLTFKLPTATEESHESDHESLHSFDNDSNTDIYMSFTKLSVLLSVTFCMCTLPLFLTEILRSQYTQISYINITTCMLALSTIQTIIYPQIIICMDSVVHRAVHKLWLKVVHRCQCRTTSVDDDVEDNRTNMNTDTSQV